MRVVDATAAGVQVQNTKQINTNARDVQPQQARTVYWSIWFFFHVNKRKKEENSRDVTLLELVVEGANVDAPGIALCHDNTVHWGRAGNRRDKRSGQSCAQHSSLT